MDLHGSRVCLSQYTWFEKGFNLIAPPLLGSLTGKELQLLICGTPELDFNELKASCRCVLRETLKSLWFGV